MRNRKRWLRTFPRYIGRPMQPLTHPTIAALSEDELVSLCAEFGEPAFRARQLRKAIFGERATSFEDISTIPRGMREKLNEECDFFVSKIATHQVARDRTEKLLLELADGERIECVLMRETRRRTVCISTQVGCAMGCVFCASGLLGVKRNLTTGEILEQVLRVDRVLKPAERLTNVVVMGIGEPLANLNALVPALERLTEPNGFALSPRRITVSTVGLPDQMREFAAIGKPFNLAVSLHASNDTLRTELVPVNRNIGIEAILAAADEYFDKTGRRVSYEYVLLGELNDSSEHARELAALMKGRNAHVNLIPMNAVSELPYHNPALPRTERFVQTLSHHGVNATVRKRKGADIDAACGQLRLKATAAGC